MRALETVSGEKHAGPWLEPDKTPSVPGVTFSYTDMSAIVESGCWPKFIDLICYVFIVYGRDFKFGGFQ